MTPTTIQIGYIASAHGLRGEVLLCLHSRGSDVLDRVDSLLIRHGDAPPVEHRIRARRPHKSGWLLILDHVSNRDEAAALKGSTVHVPTKALPPLQDDEFYLDTVIGYQMIDEVAGDLGTILGVMTTNIDILVVKDAQRRELLVPLLDGVVDHVDHSARIVRVTVPEGLLD